MFQDNDQSNDGDELPEGVEAVEYEDEDEEMAVEPDINMLSGMENDDEEGELEIEENPIEGAEDQDGNDAIDIGADINLDEIDDAEPVWIFPEVITQPRQTKRAL